MVVLGLLIAFALAPMVASALPPAGLIVVSASAPAGWVVSTSADGGALTASSAFVVGPGTSPLGAGSLELSVGSNGDGGVQVRQPGYAGVPLTSLTTLRYDTYVSVFAGCQAPYLILNVDWNFDGVTDDLLFFEPCYQTGAYSGAPVPAQGAPVLDTWQGWDALVGGWWSLNAGSFGPPLVTLASYTAAQPGTRIVNSLSGGGVRIVAGFGAGAWDNFVGDVDGLTIGVGSSTTTYDFEPAAAPVHLDVGSNGVIDFDFGTIQGAVNAANNGDSVLVDAGTYPEVVVVAKSITLKGAQAGVAGWARGGASESIVRTTDGAFQLLADGVVIDGFTIEGVVGASGISSLGAGIWTSGDHSGYMMVNNIIQGNTIGVYLNSQGGSPTTVSGNLFRDNNELGAASGDAIYSDLGAVDVAIDGNRFTGHASAAMVFAGGFSPPEGLQSGLTISNNEIADDAGSVVLFNAAHVFILGNSWSHSGGSSVFLGGGVDGVTIVGNDFFAGDFRAVRVYAGAFGEPGVVSNVAVHENNIVGNTVAGIGVVSGSYVGTLQADCNWWGSASGPAAPTNLGGLGDAIVDPDSVVNFVPWLSVPAPAPCGGLGGGPVHLDIGSNGVIDVSFGTIQPAVTVGHTGDTIYVDPGTYVEQVTISGSTRSGLALVSTVPLEAVIRAPATMTGAKAIVRVSGSSDVEIRGFTISGPGGGSCDSIEYGVLVDGGGYAVITGNHVVDIRDTPFSGCQNGVGIGVGQAFAETSGGATISGNTIQGYQKGGIVVDGPGSSATIENNIVVGAGPTGVTAQNGIQVSRGAAGTVRDNTVSDNWYDPCGDYLTCYNAAGILVFETSGVIVRGNHLSGNQAGVNLFGASFVNLLSNVLVGSAWGVIVDSSSDVLVQANTIGSPEVRSGAVQIIGIWALASDAVDIVGNSIDFGGAVSPVESLYGIAFDDSSGTISGNSILNVRMAAAYFGLQTGIGVIATGTGDVDIVSNQIRDYQKGGIVAGRVSVPLVGTVNILDNTVVGVGRTPLIAQNGIQVSGREASGVVRGNHIEGNFYTGCSHQDAAKTGCIPWEATGLLLWDVFHGTLLKTSDNHYVDNQRNFYVLQAH